MWLATLDPTVGSEMRKTRSCVVVSPPEIDDFLRTVIIAPITTGNRPAPFQFLSASEEGIVQFSSIMRALDKQHLVRRLGAVERRTLPPHSYARARCSGISPASSHKPAD